MIFKYKKIMGVFLLVMFILTPTLVAAQSVSFECEAYGIGCPDSSSSKTSSGESQSFENPLGYSSISELLRAVLDAVVTIAFPFIVLFLVYAGFLFVSAQGNEEKLGTAKKVFLWTVVGGLLILGAEALSIAIEGTVEELRDF